MWKEMAKKNANKFTHHNIKFGTIIIEDDKCIEKTS
jgi:hypothetical protein